jgi:hypothetical protein
VDGVDVAPTAPLSLSLSISLSLSLSGAAIVSTIGAAIVEIAVG